MHEGGARSTVTMSMRLPIDPTETEFAVFGPGVSHRLAGRTAEKLILGKVMMDRVTYDPTIDPSTILDRSLAEAIDEIYEASTEKVAA